MQQKTNMPVHEIRFGCAHDHTLEQKDGDKGSVDLVLAALSIYLIT